MEDKTIITLVAILALVILECAALMCGINGTLFTGVIAVIAGLAGYSAKPIIEKVIFSNKK